MDVGGVKVLAAKLEGADVKQLREAADKLRDKLGNAALVLATVLEGKVATEVEDSKLELAAGERAVIETHSGKPVLPATAARVDAALA